ncbi:MAG: ACT domain-containing protein [Nitrososphaerota archaeon]|jgi:aspartate kinase|nr:ACT domain-containing protein [Nitrososphaerota archaeon]MDG6948996.1 ACT domain-containing protein [Nitrososphaerota archaeon]
MSKSRFHEIVIIKFGGSVLDDGQAIVQAVELIARTLRKGVGVVVVVSAMKGVTDGLLTLSKGVNPNMEASLVDELLSSGEKTSARLVAASMAHHGLKPVVIDTDTPGWPIITDDRHQDANPIMDVTRQRSRETLLPIIERGEVPIVCGFLGRTETGKVTTLGRGGSDTTAVLLGSCLGSKEVVLIKDVDGVFSSDPGRVKNPQLIESLNGEEAELLAAGGAKFLHLKALSYQAQGLKIRVTSLEKLDAGTVIEGDIPETKVEVTNVETSMMTIVGIDPARFESVQAVADAISGCDAKILALSLESTSAIFYISGGREVLDRVHHVLVGERIGKAVSSYDGLAMISIRGRALETQPGIVQRVTQPLASSGINLFGIVTIQSSVRVFVSADQAQRASKLVKESMMVGVQ